MRTILLLVGCETKSFQGFYLIPKMMSSTKIVESTVLDDKRKDAYRRHDGFKNPLIESLQSIIQVKGIHFSTISTVLLKKKWKNSLG